MPPSGMIHHPLIVCFVGTPPKTVIEDASGGLTVAGIGRIQRLGVKKSPLAQGAVTYVQVLHGAVDDLVAHRAILEILYDRTAPYLIVANYPVRNFLVNGFGIYGRVFHAGGIEHMFFHIYCEILARYLFDNSRQYHIIGIIIKKPHIWIGVFGGLVLRH